MPLFGPDLSAAGYSPDEQRRLRLVQILSGLQGGLQSGVRGGGFLQNLVGGAVGGLTGAIGGRLQGEQAISQQQRQTRADDREERQARLQELVFGQKAEEVQQQAQARASAFEQIDELSGGDPRRANQLRLVATLAPEKLPDLIAPTPKTEIIGSAPTGYKLVDQRTGDVIKQVIDPVTDPAEAQRLAIAQANLGLARQDNALARERFDLERKQGGGAFAGQGLEASLLNTVVALDKKVRAGGGDFNALSPDEQVQYRVATSRLNEVARFNDPARGTVTEIQKGLEGIVQPPPVGGASAAPASGPLTVGQSSQSGGPGGSTVTTTQIGPPKPEKLAAEAAGKVALLPGALEDIAKVREGFLGSGEVDRAKVLAANPPGQGVPLLGGALEAGVPFTEGRELRSAYERAADALVRIKTGAARTESERRDMATQYLPSPADNAGQAKAKIDALERDLKAAAEAFTAGTGFKAPAGQAGGFKADVEATAKKYGRTVDQVLDDLAKAQGVPVDQLRARLQGG